MSKPSELTVSARRAARVIRFTPGITRHDLAMRLGISVSSVNPVVSQLIDAGFVEEKEQRHRSGSAGRPRSGLHLTGPADTLAVIIWSHGVLDLALTRFDSSISWRSRTSVIERPSLDQLSTAVENLFGAAAESPDLSSPFAIVLGLPAPYERGVGIAGTIPRDPDRDAQNDFTHWFDGDPVALLSERFHVPVLAENDANLGALGESRHGAAQDERCVIYLKLSGSGIGSGITINGRLFDGSHGFAGEIAHVRVDDTSTTLCVCGSRGCLEEKVGQAILAPVRTLYGEDLAWEGLLDLVDGDAVGTGRVLQDAGRTAGRALADLSTFLNPSMIVVDAGSEAASAHVLRGVTEQVDQSTPPFIRQTLKLRISELGDDAAVRGAIDLARVASIGRLDSEGVLAKRSKARRLETVRV